MDFSSQNIVIIDYGMGNVGSISNMLKYLGAKVTISSDYATIKNADKLILPGVGHFDRAMENISQQSLLEVIHEMALNKNKPFLGICLGMQLMCDTSEEGKSDGLKLVKAAVKRFRFPDNKDLKIPHMGWNYIQPQKQSNILKDLDEQSRFYFVHSYFVDCANDDDILTSTTYGKRFVSSFEYKNLIGVQFHPEKSHRFGINLFKNFLQYY
jgi:glutamine amidotransferase